jgi:tetratricopeptide (TPR) repeat protein
MNTLDDLLFLWEERRDSGNPVSPEELCAARPELLAELKWTIHALQAVESRFGFHSEGNESSSRKDETQLNLIEPLSVVRVSARYRIEELRPGAGREQIAIAVDPVLRRQVAISFPGNTRLSAEQLSQFQREARITGRLDHPGIVPVHALKHDLSDPCLVRRHVTGTTLQTVIESLHSTEDTPKNSAFCNSFEFRRLLQNLISVCNIVAYAHENGVIHGGISPTAIQLGTFGEVLLINWGKAFSVGEHADYEKRSDIRALGMTLSALLTSGLRFETDAMLEKINQHAPAPLNAIVRRAISADTEKQYSTPLELARDLERFLADERVSAQTDSVWDRLRRTVRRRPAVFSAVPAAIFVGLLASLAISLLLGRKNNQLSLHTATLEVAVRESQLASRQTMAALRTLTDDFVVSRFQEESTLSKEEKEFLSRIGTQYAAFAQLQGNFSESQAIQAEGLLQTGKIQLQLSELPMAVRRLQNAADLYETLASGSENGGFRIELADALKELSTGLLRLGRLESAEAGLVRAITLFRPTNTETFGNISSNQKSRLAELYQILGNVHSEQRRWKDAMNSYQRAQELVSSLLQETSGSDAEKYLQASVTSRISDTARHLGLFNLQLACSKQAIDLQRSLTGPFADAKSAAAGFANAILSHSHLRIMLDETAQGIDELTEAIDRIKILCQRYPLAVSYKLLLAQLYVARNNCYFQQSDHRLSEADLAEAISIIRPVVNELPDAADSHVRMLTALSELGNAQKQLNNHTAAEATYREAFALAEQMNARFPELPGCRYSAACAQVNFSGVLRKQGRLTEARDLLLNALETFRRAQISDETSSSRFNPVQAHVRLALVFKDMGMLPEARQEANKADTLAQKFTVTYSQHIEMLNRLAAEVNFLSETYDALNCPDQAMEQQHRYIKIRADLAAQLTEHAGYQKKHVKALLLVGYRWLNRRSFDMATQRFTEAEEVLNAAMTRFPNEPSLKKIQGDVVQALGGVLFQQLMFKEAMEKFDLSVRLNPSVENRSQRCYCLALMQPGEVLNEVYSIIGEGNPDAWPVLNLVYACGAAHRRIRNPAVKEELGAMAARLLQHAIATGHAPGKSSAKELRRHIEISSLRRYPEFMQQLKRIDGLHADKDSPGPSGTGRESPFYANIRKFWLRTKSAISKTAAYTLTLLSELSESFTVNPIHDGTTKP